VILRRSAEAGELVQPGAPIVTFGSRSRGVVLRAGLADRDVVRLQRGNRAVARFAALPGRTFDGTVTEIAAAADPATGTYQVEVTISGAAGLASGLVGQLEIRPAARATMTLVPVDALLEADGDHATVFTLSADGRRAVRRHVTILVLAGDRVAVSGLDGVGRVITDGAAYLDEGDAVLVQP
jgi:RND family efflux transporter MFP subunit